MQELQRNWKKVNVQKFIVIVIVLQHLLHNYFPIRMRFTEVM